MLVQNLTPAQLEQARRIIAFLNDNREELSDIGIISVAFNEELGEVIWNTIYGPSTMTVPELISRYHPS